MPKSNKKNTNTKSKKSFEGLTQKVFKPRHSVEMHCAPCGYTFRAGGIETKKQRIQIEKEQRAIHDKNHKNIVKYLGGAPEGLTVKYDYHAAEITHAYTEVATSTSEFTTTSTSYVDVTNASIAAGSFTANQDHLVMVTAHLNHTTANNVLVYAQMMRGTTAITDSEVAMDPPVATSGLKDQRMIYNWWGIVNHTAAETVKMQIKTVSGTAAVDLVSISMIKLTPDLTLNTDYKYNFPTPTNTTISVLDSTANAVGSDTTTNNATVSITPSVNNHKWLILSKARYGNGISASVGVNTRIDRSGGSTSSVPEMETEGEDATNGVYVLCGARTDTLTNTQTHTYTEISRLRYTGTVGVGSTVSATRTHSAIFMLDLDKFKVVSVNQEDTPLESISTTTDYGYLAHTQSITPLQTGDVMVFCHAVMIPAQSGSDTAYWKCRARLDNNDLLGGTTITTTKAYKLAYWDAEDRIPFMRASIKSMTAAAHTIDIDASVAATNASRGTLYRNITLFTMEMSSTALTNVKGESEAINEGIVKVLGHQLVKVISESEGSTEATSKALGTSTNFITSSNFQLRGSGASNLGGTMSGSVLGSQIFDNVTLAEATSGDATPDHRCFYIYNSHTSLSMIGLKIWFGDNTQGDDYVEMGLGNSAIGSATSETAIANENTAPSPTVTFTLAPSESTAMTIGDIPAGQHKAIWLRRTVPANTANPVFNNRYTIMAKFVTNHV